MIGGWNIGNEDRAISGKFASSSISDVLFINPTSGWAMLERFTGISWNQLYNNSGNHYIAGWYLQNSDRYVVNDFDNDGKDELLCIGTNWAVLFKYNAGTWTQIWSNSGNSYIGNWHIDLSDKYSTGKFDNIYNIPELLCVNNNSRYAMLARYNNGIWTNIWSNNGNGWIAGWLINSSDFYLTVSDVREYSLKLFPLGWGVNTIYDN